MPLLLTSAQIPAGQTKPIRIPKGSKLSVEPAVEGTVIGGKLQFYYNDNHISIDYPMSDLEKNRIYNFEFETGCFHNISTVEPNETIKVSAHSYPVEPN